jgi:quinol monooxygenase YgiN
VLSEEKTMGISRRGFVGWLAALSASSTVSKESIGMTKIKKYGLIGKIIAVPGERGRLADILINGVSGMPGCINYVVANDLADSNSLWVTEVWESRESHSNSLSLESVREAITLGKPLISGFGERFETEPLGGLGS